jgi:PAS domain S-box-containing protein
LLQSIYRIMKIKINNILIKKSFFLILLILASFIGNFFPLTLLFGIDLLFGSVFVIIAIHHFNWRAGIIVASIASAYSFVLWGNPFAWIIYVLEALVIGYLYKKGRSLFFAECIFWLFIATPLIILFCVVFLHMTNSFWQLVLTKQIFNGFLNVSLAILLIKFFNVEGYKNNKLVSSSLEESIRWFSLATLLVPLLILMVLESRDEYFRMTELSINSIEEAYDTNLKTISQDIETDILTKKNILDDLSKNKKFITLFTQNKVRDFEQNFQLSLQHFDHVLLVNNGIVVADYLSKEASFSNKMLGKDLFLQPSYKESLKSNRVEISSANSVIDNQRIITIVTPISTEPLHDTSLIGVITKKHIASIISNRILKFGQFNFELFDNNLKLFFSNLPSVEIPGGHPGVTWSNLPFENKKNLFHLIIEDENVPTLTKWRNSYFMKEKMISNEFPWKLTILSPLKNQVDTLSKDYTFLLFVIFGIVLVSMIFTTYFARKIVKPLVELTKITNDIKLNPDMDYINWPTSSATETDLLIDAFKNNHQIISQSFQQLTEQNVEIKRLLGYNKAILEASLDAMITIDSSGNVIDFNNVAEDVFGWSYDEIVGKNLAEYIIPENMREAHTRGMKHFFETGNGPVFGKRLELFGLHRDGHVIPIEISISPTKSDSEQIFTAFIKDISERRDNENKLINAQQLSKQVADNWVRFIDTANAPIFGIDAKGKINEWNQKAAEITGFHADEVRGKDLVEEFITANYRHSVNEVFQKALQGDETSNFEFSLHTQINNSVMILLNATTRRDELGNVVGAVGVGQDITELHSYRSEMEVKVTKRTRELNTILTLSPDGFVLVSADNYIRYINPAFLDMTGLKSDALIDKPAEIFVELMNRLFDPNQIGGKIYIGGEDVEQIVYLSGPSVRILKVNHRTMYGSNGCKEGEVLYFRDVTHETEVDRMKSDFLSTAAHELRTPLASIYGFSELLMARDYDKNTSYKILETIHRQSLNLKHLLDELLDLSRIEARAGKDFHMEDNTLQDIVKESCVEVEGAFSGRKVNVQIMGDWPVLSFDIDKMRQVFSNLLSNAFKYSPESEDVILQTSEREKNGNKQFGVIIIDNGIGMTPEQLARVGERFYRVDESGFIPGSGLGVSLVKEIISIHGGDVEFSSVAGKGTRVTVWLTIVNINPQV